MENLRRSSVSSTRKWTLSQVFLKFFDQRYETAIFQIITWLLLLKQKSFLFTCYIFRISCQMNSNDSKLRTSDYVWFISTILNQNSMYKSTPDSVYATRNFWLKIRNYFCLLLIILTTVIILVIRITRLQSSNNALPNKILLLDVQVTSFLPEIFYSIFTLLGEFSNIGLYKCLVGYFNYWLFLSNQLGRRGCRKTRETSSP